VVESSTLDAIGGLDYVFHFASPASPPKYLKLGLETIAVNTQGTQNLINVALRNSARLVFASTSEVYGDPLVSPQSEEYWGNVNPIGPRSVYDESKRLGETIVALHARNHDLRAGIVRIFNTYGPGMNPHDGRVVSTFIRQGISEEPFTIFGDGMQTRSFCFVDDLIEGVIAMAQSEEFGPVNLGNPREISLVELGGIIANLCGIKPKFVTLPLPQDDPKHRKPDISRASNLLGWQPRVGLEEGIRITRQWMLSHEL
jgi:dTDP-glucose 4,6-dehydratase